MEDLRNGMRQFFASLTQLQKNRVRVLYHPQHDDAGCLLEQKRHTAEREREREREKQRDMLIQHMSADEFTVQAYFMFLMLFYEAFFSTLPSARGPRQPRMPQRESAREGEREGEM